jgi:hypothetical protein
MLARLRDHIERLDDGVAHAADDLAVVLRALLCNSRGNDVLVRLLNACGRVRPQIILSRPPDTSEDVRFSIGSMPIQEKGALADGGTGIPITKWASTRMMVINTMGRRREFTWSQFLNDYANKWGGAHLDLRVPPHLQVIDQYATGGLFLSSYLLRVAAVEIWHATQKVLALHFRPDVSEADRLIEDAIFRPWRSRRASAQFTSSRCHSVDGIWTR